MYNITFSKKAIKDLDNLRVVHLDGIARNLIQIIQNNPFQNPPPFEKLVGNLKGLYSRRINQKHRLVYDVRQNEQAVMILSMWSHYGE